MGSWKQVSVICVLASTVFLSCCVLAPEKSDPLLQQNSIERWQLCLKRYTADIEHYCDGHRRDVLATFPVYQRSRVNAILIATTRKVSHVNAVKTILERDSAEK